MKQRGFVLVPVILVILIGIAGYLIYQKVELKKSNVNLPSPTSVEINTQSKIEGKITLNYEIPEFPNVNDDIAVLISEKGENETNYFSAVNCERNKDNCVWLISEIGNKRIYGYRLTLEGGPDTLRVGEKYKVYVSIRHYNDGGNIGGTESNKVSVEIPASGFTTQDFNLSVNPL